MYLCNARISLCTYVCRHITAVCRHVGSSQVTKYRSTRVANLLGGQLCPQASVELHLYTWGTKTHIPWTHRPTSAQTYVHTHAKLQRCTITRANLSTRRVHYVRRSGYSCQNTVRVQVQRASPNTWTIARSVHHPGYPCQMLRLSISNTVRVHVQRAISSTRTIA